MDNLWHHLLRSTAVTLVILVLLPTSNGLLDLFPDLGEYLNTPDFNRVQIAEVIKDEVQLLNKEFSKSAQLQSYRRKRALGLKVDYRVVLDTDVHPLEINLAQQETFIFSCYEEIILLQLDGIYKLKGFNELSYNDGRSDSPDFQTYAQKVSSWTLRPGDKFLHGMEWGKTCFVLVSNSNGTFSSVYTLHRPDMEPVLRQQIRNYGIVTSATLFDYRKNLYLILTNDNSGHSLTNCPLFRWAGTYMDEIHSIQTRGAKDSTTFIIHSKIYIAIAQSEDATGNYEVGTQVLRMDQHEDIEKVQLLWSNNAIALQYIKVNEGQHYLVVAMENEPSIVYWFAGMDFIPWQTLDGVSAPNLFLDSFQLPYNEPVMMAAQGRSLEFFTRSPTTIMMTLDPKSAGGGVKGVILNAQFLRPNPSQTLVAVTERRLDPPSFVLSIHQLLVIQKPLADSQIAEPESKLSKCLVELSKKLDNELPRVEVFDVEKDNILTVDGSCNYSGIILAQASVTVQQDNVYIQSLTANPFINKVGLEGPGKVLATTAQDQSSRLNPILGRLEHVFRKSQPGSVSGNYQFQGGFNIGEFIGLETNLGFETINGIDWNDLHEYALRRNVTDQKITGYWVGESLISQDVDLPSSINYIQLTDLLRQECSPNAEVEILEGEVEFLETVRFEKGLLISPESKINSVEFSDIILQNGGGTKYISGFKKVTNLQARGPRFQCQVVNNVNLTDWISSVMLTDGPAQTSGGTKTFSSSLTNIFSLLVSGRVNERSWKEFYSTALTNGTDQIIIGSLSLSELTVDALEADSIGGTRSEDLLSYSSEQKVYSTLVVNQLRVDGNLTTKNINGIPFSSLAVTSSEPVSITGSVELESCKVDASIGVQDKGLIDGKDVSELGKMRRNHFYHTKDGEPIVFKGAVSSTYLYTDHLNSISLDDMEDKYWTTQSENRVTDSLNLSGRSVNTEDFHTGTLNYLQLDELVRTDQEQHIRSKLSFMGPVYSYSKVNQEVGKKLSSVDLSKVAEFIVRPEDTRSSISRVIRGVKYFNEGITGLGGITINSIGGLDPVRDVVFLYKNEEQSVVGSVEFLGPVRMQTLEVTGVDIDLKGEINGQNLENVIQTTAYDQGPVIIHSNILFNNTLEADDIQVEEECNGLNLPELLASRINVNEEQQLYFPVVITNYSSIDVQGYAQVAKINGINLTDYLSKVVRLDPVPEYRINHTKTFLYLEMDNLECYSFNGVSLLDLKEGGVSKTGSQNLTGLFTFESLSVEGDLKTSDIGGRRLEDLIYLSDPNSCSTNSNVHFTADKTTVRGLKLDGLFNNYAMHQIHQSPKGVKNLRSLVVKGDLNWKKDLTGPNTISSFYRDVVSKDGVPQNITGTVTFARGFQAMNLQSEPSWIDDVNLKEIEQDSWSSEQSPEILGAQTFLQPLEISNSPTTVRRISVHTVNGVNLEELGKNAISRDSIGMITGKKTITGGINATVLNAIFVNGNLDYESFITRQDNRRVDYIEFHDVDISSMDLNMLNDDHFQSFLDDRISRSGNQTLDGNYTISSLEVTRNCSVSSINGILVDELYLDEGKEDNTIHGEKNIDGNVSIQGWMFAPEINDINFTALSADTYRKDRDEIINRPVIFNDSVVIYNTIHVQDSVNDYIIDDLSNRMSSYLQRHEELAYPKSGRAAALDYNLHELKNLQRKVGRRSVWLEYLREYQDLRGLGPTQRVQLVKLEEEEWLVGFHSKEAVDPGSFLPFGCHCNNVNFLVIGNPSNYAELVKTFPCSSSFIVSSPIGNLYSIVDTSVSYNASCSNAESGSLLVMAGLILENDSTGTLFSGPSNGFLVDVKAFSVNGVDYLVFAYHFDSYKGSHDTHTYVYKVDKLSLKLVQTLQTPGVERLDILFYENKWQLAVGNSKGPDLNSCKTKSAVYLWEETQDKFLLLREFPTHKVVDVSFGGARDRSVVEQGDGISFLAFAQNGNSGDGEVSLYKYDKELETYHMLQAFRFSWPVSAVNFMYVRENSFLLIAVPNEGIHIFEYKYVEGFQPFLTVPVLGVQDVDWFTFDQRLILPIASAKGSVLAEGVLSGQLFTMPPLKLNPDDSAAAEKETELLTKPSSVGHADQHGKYIDSSP